MRQNFLLMAVLLVACKEKHEETAMRYPPTKKVDTVDTYFDVQVKDPYRWLEDDRSEETAQWVQSQNEVTFSYLANIPYREKVRKRLEEIWNFPKYTPPFKKGGRYFFLKNNGLQNQAALYVQNDLQSEPELLLDPNAWSGDGTIALGTVSPSSNGKYIAYSISQSGSDWQRIIVMDMLTRQALPDTLHWTKFSSIAWKGNGFYYSRYDKPAGSDLTAKNEFQKVYYHRIGDSQAKDQLIFEDTSVALRYYSAQTTEDENFLVLYISQGTSGNGIKIKDLRKPTADFVTIINDFENDHRVIDNVGDEILILTNKDASNQKIIKTTLANPGAWKDFIPESGHRISGAAVTGGKLFVECLVDASDKIFRYDLKGNAEGTVDLPGIGTIGGFGGDRNDKEFFYSFTSFTSPTAIYKYSVDQNKSELYRKAEIDFDPNNYETKQVFYESKDGTKVPMFIVYKKGIKLDGSNPALLYSYGGFDISLTPNFSVSRLVWLENGGIYAQASIRGGGEYGEKWHKGGMLLNKQNVFNDFIAAAEYLIKEKYTSSDKLAIAGGSNGGLLVGAIMTQRPELARVAFPAVGVMDMLRYEKFTVGWGWAVEYGSAQHPDHFKNLLSYSPLHNLKDGVEYPATLVTTADHDDRVVPAHSFKFIATLQEKHKGDNPVLIRIDTKAGHGAGKPTSKVIEEEADKWSFAWYNMGIMPPIAKEDL